MNDFKVGEYIAYIQCYIDNDNKMKFNVEIGRIKKLCKDGAFVYYHTGETAAKTRYCDMYKIRNEYAIENLGGEEGQKYFKA